MSLTLRSIAALYRLNRSIHSNMRMPHPFRVLCGMGGSRGSNVWLGSIVFFSFVCLALPARAVANESIPTPEALAQLELRAAQAKPREQCFLYAELVHGLTKQAAAQLAADDTDHASATLRQIDQDAHLIQRSLARNSNRLKDAQKLLHDTTFRLGQLLHLVSGDDRATVQETLKQLNQLNDELLTQVFNH
jgi:hypothetical protein